MSQQIKISVTGADTAEYVDLINFQGDLKILTEEKYQNFRRNLIKNGFIEPIGVWIDPDSKYRILNGHQRLATVKRMVENEGFQVERLPINLIEASSLEDAKLKLLALTSEYGEMTREGLVNFISDMSLPQEELSRYLKEVTALNRVSIDEVLSQVAQLKSEISLPDPLDVGQIVVGADYVSPEGIAEPDKKIKNDPMTGLRLVQVFLTDEQLVNFKSNMAVIQEEYSLDNVTEGIIKAVELTAAGCSKKEAPLEKNKNIRLKKSKK